MIKNYYIPFLLIVFKLIAYPSFSQYQQQDADIFKKNKVKSLIVWTDSLKNGCPIDLFEYDKNGNTIMYHFGITLDEKSYRYDSENRLTDIYSYWEDFSPHTIDTNYHSTLIYDNQGKYLYTSSYRYSDSAIIIDSTYPIRKTTFKEYIYNNNQLISHSVDSIYLPCLSPWINKHRIEYYYFENGLIRKLKIIPLSMHGRKSEWFFEYEYF